jgi:DNA-binding NtrC family response regulator
MNNLERNRSKILVVEDNEAMAAVVSLYCEKYGFEACVSSDGKGVDAHLESGVSAMVMDLSLPDADGLEILRSVRKRFPKLPCFVMTGSGKVSHAVQALKSGALDYFSKPFDPYSLMEAVRAAVERSGDASGSLYADSPELALGYEWKSTRMREVQQLLGQASRRMVPVLIHGESGTGKTELAHSIHLQSIRKSGAFVVLNCDGLGGDAIETELFGDGLGMRRRAKMLIATGGTLYLKGIEKFPPGLQAAFLMVLESGQFCSVGSESRQRADFRLICGTQVDLAAEVEAGRFNAALLTRISSLVVKVPSLCERVEDIPLLCEHMITQVCVANRCRRPTLSRKVLERFADSPWPENLRELRAVLEHAISATTDGMIDLDDLPESIRGSQVTARPPLHPLPMAATMDELERCSLIAALEAYGGNRRRAAARLGVSLRTVYNMISRHGLQNRDGSAN